MVDPVFQSNTMLLAQKLLDAAAMRQDAIAANIANASTPGYRRVDLAPDFEQQLKSSFEAGDLATEGQSIQPTLTEDASAKSVRPDGNSVQLEQELLTMNRNAVQYDYLTDVVSYNIKQLKIAIGSPSS
jgi:flagellar basal-body rod protein FlgB